MPTTYKGKTYRYPTCRCGARKVRAIDEGAAVADGVACAIDTPPVWRCPFDCEAHAKPHLQIAEESRSARQRARAATRARRRAGEARVNRR